MDESESIVQIYLRRVFRSDIQASMLVLKNLDSL